MQKYIAELEAAATHLMALLAAQYNRRGGMAPQPVYSDDPDDQGYGNDQRDATAAPRSAPRPSNDSPEIHGM